MELTVTVRCCAPDRRATRGTGANDTRAALEPCEEKHNGFRHLKDACSATTVARESCQSARRTSSAEPANETLARKTTLDPGVIAAAGSVSSGPEATKSTRGVVDQTKVATAAAASPQKPVRRPTSKTAHERSAQAGWETADHGHTATKVHRRDDRRVSERRESEPKKDNGKGPCSVARMRRSAVYGTSLTPSVTDSATAMLFGLVTT